MLLAWYPASHAARTMIADDNFAQTWYIFWKDTFLSHRDHHALPWKTIAKNDGACRAAPVLSLQLLSEDWHIVLSAKKENDSLAEDVHFDSAHLPICQ